MTLMVRMTGYIYIYIYIYIIYIYIYYIYIYNLYIYIIYIYIYEHEAIQKPISENNIGAPSAPQKVTAEMWLIKVIGLAL